MEFLNWKNGRVIVIVVSLLTAGLLVGIIPALTGIGIEYKFLGLAVGTLVGIANFFSAYILWKIL